MVSFRRQLCHRTSQAGVVDLRLIGVASRWIQTSGGSGAEDGYSEFAGWVGFADRGRSSWNSLACRWSLSELFRLHASEANNAICSSRKCASDSYVHNLRATKTGSGQHQKTFSRQFSRATGINMQPLGLKTFEPTTTVSMRHDLIVDNTATRQRV